MMFSRPPPTKPRPMMMRATPTMMEIIESDVRPY
jgi:hypothetical protein